MCIKKGFVFPRHDSQQQFLFHLLKPRSISIYYNYIIITWNFFLILFTKANKLLLIKLISLILFYLYIYIFSQTRNHFLSI